MSWTRRCEAEGERRGSLSTGRSPKVRPVRWTVGSLLVMGLVALPIFRERSLLLPPEPTPPPSMPNPRLDPPQISSNPTQLERGAYNFWLYCLPCHGDQGQGLTDEFRTLYPPDHQDCWASGCHGERPYPNGWTLPSHVPAIIGREALPNYDTAASLFTFIQAAMPFEAPGSLDTDTYWEVVAYLAEKNGVLPDGIVVSPDNAEEVRFARLAAGSLAEFATPTSLPALPPETTSAPWPLFFGLVIIGISIAGGLLVRDLRVASKGLRIGNPGRGDPREDR